VSITRRVLQPSFECTNESLCNSTRSKRRIFSGMNRGNRSCAKTPFVSYSILRQGIFIKMSHVDQTAQHDPNCPDWNVLSIILWSSRDLTPWCPVDMCQRFGETCSQYLQGRICPGFSETMAPIYQNKGHRSPECSSLDIQRHKNFKPQIIFTVSRYCIGMTSSKSQWWSNVLLLHVYVCANMTYHLYFVVLNV
jgi:hypothetical protein